MIQKKICIDCQNKKLLDEFTIDKRKKDGHGAICKPCKNIRVKNSSAYKKKLEDQRKLYAESEVFRQSMKNKAAKFRKENNEKVLLSQAKVRANRYGLDFNIDLSDINIPDVCPILYVKLERGKGVKSNYSPSVDRIDNDKGYVKDNVRVISYLANHMKTNASYEELLSFAQNIEYYLFGDEIV